MNSNLIPEQRLDKNGRLNTKHVRATKKTANTASVPAPALPTAAPGKKKLTPGQTVRKDRLIPFTTLGNYDLTQKLGISPHSEDIKVHASDEEIYSVLSVTSPGNALALLQSGITSADEATGYLMDNGFEEQLTDRSARLCDEALARRISPVRFMEAAVALPSPDGSPHYLDALEVYASNYTKKDRTLINKVYEGDVKLSDIKEIGLKKLGTFRNAQAVTIALLKIGTGNANYTSSDVSAIMDKHSYMFNDALDLTQRYGLDLALSLDSPDTEYANYLEEQGADKGRIMELLSYSDQISTQEREHEVYREPLHYATVEKCFNAGITPAQVATEDYTDQQLDALIQGVTPGVSSGWL